MSQMRSSTLKVNGYQGDAEKTSRICSEKSINAVFWLRLGNKQTTMQARQIISGPKLKPARRG